jgi:hypothetical protein
LGGVTGNGTTFAAAGFIFIRLPQSEDRPLPKIQI